MSEKNIKLGNIYSWFSVILVGAIGSGLWDLFLKDLLYWIGDIFVRIASSFYKGYFDRLYEGVGNQIELILYFPGIMLFVLVTFSPLIMFNYMSTRLRKIERALDNDEESETKESSKIQEILFNQFENHRLRFKLILISPLFLVSLAFLDIFIVSASSSEAIRGIERRLDIIRPYISENISYKLTSDFRLVDSRQTLQNIINDIDKIAVENNLTLPEVRLYGIESSNKRVN